MKKRPFLFVILSALVLTSCNFLSTVKPVSRSNSSSNGRSQFRFSNSKEDSENSSEEDLSSLPVGSSKHTHTFDTEKWEYDEEHHWRPATCEHTDLRRYTSDHTFGGSFDIVKATCDHPGSYKQECSVCGYVKVTETPQLEHDWQFNDDIAIIQPTKHSNGHRFYTCSICGTTKDEVLTYGETLETALTVDEALEIGMNLEVKGQTAAPYFIKGRVSEIVYSISHEGTGTFWLASSTKSQGFQCYRISTSENVNVEEFGIGSEVVAFGCITRYSEDVVEIYTNSQIISVNYMYSEITSLSFESDAISMMKGQSKKISLSILPFYGNSKLNSFVSNPDIVFFDLNTFTIVGNNPGVSTVTVFVDKNENGLPDDGEVYASMTVTVEENDYFFNSENLLGYYPGANITINSGQIVNNNVAGINFELSGIASSSSQNGCLRLRTDGYIKAYDFESPIAKIIIERYENRNLGLSLLVGQSLESINQQPAVSYEEGCYVFNLSDDVHAFVINNNSGALSYFNSIAIVLAQ